MIEVCEIYKYTNFIYTCKRCYQQFPIWWIDSKTWRKACKIGGWGQKATICKQCFEEFGIPEPHYASLDEYVAIHVAAHKELMTLLHTDPKDYAADFKTTLSKIWDLPPSFSKEDRDNMLAIE